MRPRLMLILLCFAIAGCGGGGSSSAIPVAGGVCSVATCGTAGVAAGGGAAAAAGAVCGTAPVTGVGNTSFIAAASGGAWCFNVNNYSWGIAYPALSAGAGANVAVATSGMTGSGFTYPVTPAAFPPGHNTAGTVFLYIEIYPSATITWWGSPALSVALPFAASTHSEYDAQLFDLTTGATLDAGRAMTTTATPSSISQGPGSSGAFTLIANHSYDLQFVYY